MSSRDAERTDVGVERRSVLHGAALAAGGVLLGGAIDLAAAGDALAGAQPTVYTRGDWNARRPKSWAVMRPSPPDRIVVHHTATANSANHSKGHAFALSRAIQNYHMDTNGWNDTGQQLTISRGGHIMEGRNRSLKAIAEGHHLVGAHTANHNSHTIGIENEGNYVSATPPRDLMGALTETCAWLCLAYGLDPADAIVGHRDYNATACPGDRLYALLPQLRSDVRSRLRGLKARLMQRGDSDVPEEHLPTYPDVPADESRALFYHGPAVGPRDN
ncbi:peptidoglycan recognition protein family protein [Streptomonospora wellingtoniae]|uniref:Peptidoglycan recognition family protein n=1 Tax=Streptomonospora wellingtoniae TaxID=3075544 RepID=A0ABU2KRR0_9ACTN|nr:peptidoglycan recognition family protein [Streptomonospora sp. DSM 45055]MDT0301969.1 peptidoglycan recognition family protein [Streptomonospora sp. DSM 45055]